MSKKIEDKKLIQQEKIIKITLFDVLISAPSSIKN